MFKKFCHNDCIHIPHNPTVIMTVKFTLPTKLSKPAVQMQKRGNNWKTTRIPQPWHQLPFELHP